MAKAISVDILFAKSLINNLRSICETSFRFSELLASFEE